jgi:CRISPR-associated protein (TIGR02710 family)
MNAHQNHPAAMLVNVGGATAPAVHTLNEQQPRFICFFVSAESKSAIQSAILPALNYSPEHYDWIETPAPQSLLACYQALYEELPRLLRKWGVSPEQLAVEYTAGTKPMSVAAALMTIETSSQYFYVGARDPSGRDRDGIGVVLDGKEFTWFQTNPWEALAVRARQEIALLFNLGRFAEARERVQRLEKVVSPELQPVYRALADLIEGYLLWDRFEYKRAQAQISRALDPLKIYLAGRADPLRATLDEVEAQVSFLRRRLQDDEEASRLDILDLVANAQRRAEKARRYDDAVARLYSALESLARYRLWYSHRIKTGGVPADALPEALRETYVRQYSDPSDPNAPLKLGLDASYRLLAALDDPLGRKYLEREKDVSQVLNARNQSRLAHGSNPLREDVYQRMLAIVMDFAGIVAEDLPQFPTLRL